MSESYLFHHVDLGHLKLFEVRKLEGMLARIGEMAWNREHEKDLDPDHGHM